MLYPQPESRKWEILMLFTFSFVLDREPQSRLCPGANLIHNSAQVCLEACLRGESRSCHIIKWSVAPSHLVLTIPGASSASSSQTHVPSRQRSPSVLVPLRAHYVKHVTAVWWPLLTVGLGFSTVLSCVEPLFAVFCALLFLCILMVTLPSTTGKNARNMFEALCDLHHITLLSCLMSK